MKLLSRQSISEPIRSIEVGSYSLETDTSEHSYTLRDVLVHGGRARGARSGTPEIIEEPRPSLDEFAATPFGRPDAQRASAFSQYRERMSGHTSDATSPHLTPAPSVPPGSGAKLPRKARRAHSNPLRVSIDLEQLRAVNGVPKVTEVEGQIVRKRRRLPLKIVILFGLISICCLLVGLTTLSIGIYNFTKLRAGRAAKSIDDLEKELLPILNELLERAKRR